MHESIREANYGIVVPSQQERAAVYFGDHMDMIEREAAQHLAASFENIDQPMQRTAVLIPVAAHQDAGHIFPAMEQYAKQRGCDPFTIFLYLNTPSMADAGSHIDFAYAEIARAAQAFPGLDIRVADMQYDEPTIGAIRRDLWNAVLFLANHEGLLGSGTNEVIGINNDIDSLFISPHYIARIQKHYAVNDESWWPVSAPKGLRRPVGTRLTHAVLPSHPNVGKVTQWIDNSYFQSPGHTYYEAGIAIPFSYYMSRRGFRRAFKTHETSWMLVDGQINVLSAAQLYTSPRRYIDRLSEHGSSGIWTNDSFGANDRCRELLMPDLSESQAEDIIFARLQHDVYTCWLEGGIASTHRFIDATPLSVRLNRSNQTHVYDYAKSAATKQLAKAERFLRIVVKSDVLADILHDSIDVGTFVDSRIQSLSL